MEWEDFYDRFYDWAESTQIQRISRLTTFGPSDEVSEIIQEYSDEKAASRLLRKALAANVRFSPDEILNLLDYVSEDCYTDLLHAASAPFTVQHREDLADYVDDSDLEQLAEDHPELCESFDDIEDTAELDWDTFYGHFYDWSEEIQQQRFSQLLDFGESEEVSEIAQEYYGTPAAEPFVCKALNAGVRFTPQEITELIDLISPMHHRELLLSNSEPYKEQDIADLFCTVDDRLLAEVAGKYRLHCEELEDAMDNYAPASKKGKGWGTFWAVLLGISSGLSEVHSRKNRSHSMRCNGDCANCPPHYGYRYGRWYYGRCHQYGCEFGGNKGDGSMD